MDFLLQRIQSAITSATQGMSLEQFKWHPEGKWNAAEILEHLSLSYSGTRVGCERCLQSGKPTVTAATLKDRISTMVVVKLGYLPSGQEAPRGTRPKGASPENIVAVVQEQLAAMDEAIWQCEERFGRRMKILTHPILGPLTAPEWRKFHWVHARHHLRQIEGLRSAMPGSK